VLNSMYVYGFPGDVLTYLYGIWMWNNGFIKTVFPNQTVFVYLLGFSIRIFGSAWGLNVFLLSTFALSYFFTYRFLRVYVGKEASCVGALIYSFSQYFIWHAMQHPEIVLASAFIPILIDNLLKLETENNSLKAFSFRALMCGTTLTAIFLSSFYVGYFASISSLGSFAIFRLWSVWKTGITIHNLGRSCFGYLIIFVVLAILTLPATGPVIRYYLGGLDSAAKHDIEKGITRNTIFDLVAYGARPWDYLMPSIHNPLVGSAVSGFDSYIRSNFSYQYWSPSLPERINFLTFTGLALSSSVLVLLRLKVNSEPPFSAERQRTIFFFCFLSVIMFLVSLPPVFSFRGLQVYLPSSVLFKVFPMFRVYARAGVFVLFCTAALSAFSWDFLISRLKKGDPIEEPRLTKPAFKKSTILTLLLCSFIVFENITIPPLPVMDLSRVPKVYSWIKNEPGELLIAEYPRDNSKNDLGGGCPSWLGVGITRDYNHTYEFYYQTIHHKRVFDYTKLSKEDKITMASLESEEAYRLLKGNGVNFVVVHTKDPIIGIQPWPYPQENPLDSCWMRRVTNKPTQVYKEFKIVADFDDGVVYKVQ